MLIARLIENIEPVEERVNLAEQIVGIGQPLSFPAEIIRWLIQDQSGYPNSITEKDREKLAKILAERIFMEVSGGLSLIDEFPEQSPWLFALWSKYKSKDEVNNYLNTYIDEDKANLYKVLKCYVPTAYPMMGGGLPHKK
jgi:hypothetical protein